MQRPNEDRSERTKRHLTRNLLVNPELQRSPIPEQERSSPDSDSLPDLIVEPAPNRHDDPPEYYEGLEHRMKQYYRHLFLGAHGSDQDISSDFEVYRSMESTSNLDIDTGKDNSKGDSIRETQSVTSINSDDEIEEIIDNKSVSEDSTQDYHRMSTTIAQIHKPRPERPQNARSSSPVLMPRLTQSRRGGFGTINSVGRHSGQSLDVLLASGAKELQDMSTDSDDMNATQVESEADHNIGRILDDLHIESSYDHSTGRITEDMHNESNDMSTPDQNDGKINASHQEIDNMNTSNFNKRKTAAIGESLPVKKKK